MTDHHQHADAQDDSDRGQQSAWVSRLRLKLPMLGEISAQLDLGDHSLRLKLSVTHQQITNQLHDQQPALLEALDSAGFELGAFSVQRHDAAPLCRLIRYRSARWRWPTVKDSERLAS